MGKGTIHDLELQATMKMRPKSLRLNRLRLPLNGFPDFIRVFGLKWRINYSYIIIFNNRCQEKTFIPYKDQGTLFERNNSLEGERPFAALTVTVTRWLIVWTQ
jgi:hypothetical protein